MQRSGINNKSIGNKIRRIQQCALDKGVTLKVIQDYDLFFECTGKSVNKQSRSKLLLSGAILFVLIAFGISTVDYISSARCLLPSNYLVWEATRPLNDCSYCINVTEPIILQNVTRQEFAKYAYSSKPMIVKNSIGHWKAVKEFSYDVFKGLYEETSGSYEILEEGCQFLNFKSDLFSLKEVFSMAKERVNGEQGQKPWYVGWGNCHQDILKKLRKFYDTPDFLPEDAEFPATENIFMGFEIGAVMHLDYIERLMWQGQVQGAKLWSVAPVPECDYICHKFSFYVETKDIVLLDTRIWYHETSIPMGQFSITVQSEYG